MNKWDINRVSLTLKDNKDMFWLTEEVKITMKWKHGALTSYLWIKSSFTDNVALHNLL